LRFTTTLLTVLCAATAGAGTIAGRVALKEKGGKPGNPADVVLYLEGVKTRPTAVTATVIMKGKQFLPRVTVVPVGSTVTFPNQDPIFHNAFSVSGDNRFDLDLYKRPKAGSFTFKHPGLVRVYCNIHPQMSAVVLVVDSAFHTRPAADGTFLIPDVPPGQYALRAWHERGGEAAFEVTVPRAGEVVASLALDASTYKRVRHKNKYGKDYQTSEIY
jgi:plastocyanin